MKARIFEIKRFAVHDGRGIRTTVFFNGCPLRCVWCHNPEGLDLKPKLAYYSNKCISCGECVLACAQNAHTLKNGIHTFDRSKCISCGNCEKTCPGSALKLYGSQMTVDQLLPMLLEDRDFYDTSGGGVTFSGGECMLQINFLEEVLKKCKEQRIHTAIDTAGHVPRSYFERIIPYTDMFLYDLKAFDEDAHIKYTGKPNKLILDNLVFLDSCGKDIEIRIPYVPGCNDGEMEKIANFLSQTKNVKSVKILPYHRYAESKYISLGMKSTLQDRLPTEEEINKAKELFTKYNISVY